MLTYTSVVVLVVVEEYLCGAIKTEVVHAPASHLNKWVFSCRRNVTSWMFRWQCSKTVDQRQRSSVTQMGVRPRYEVAFRCSG